MHKQLLYLLIPTLLFFHFCQKETFTTDSGDQLEFSLDTLRFDTVFTQLGSATRFFKIYNPHKEFIRISKIYLEDGGGSRFNLNVDGLPGDMHTDLEIAPEDSMYVFAEVTINPDEPPSSSPFVISENIVFETNGNVQRVNLEAFGQNAVYLPSRFDAGNINAFGCNGGEWVWDDPRPYVIYGILVIDDCTVRIPAGARVHVHGGLARQVIDDTTTVTYNDGFLAFQGTGRLLVEGTADQPVVFEGDRLESEFAETSGQWTGIWLQEGTQGHSIEHCIIRNSIVGIRVDSAADLTLKNSIIHNTANSGLLGVHADITAENCLFYNNIGLSIQLEYGGNYQFDYVTAANYGVNGICLRMGNALCLNPSCSEFVSNPLNATFRNCILSGSRRDQLILFDRLNDPAAFQYSFQNCIVRVDNLLDEGAWPEFPDNCQPCIFAELQDTIFIDPNQEMYRLDTLNSIANGFALPIPGIPSDLDGKMRDAVMPDAGCYENEF